MLKQRLEGGPTAFIVLPINVARVNYEIENYEIVSELYFELKKKEPDLAHKYAYLGLIGEEAAKAAAAMKVNDVVLWEE